MSGNWGQFCTETDEEKIIKVAEQMVSENVDFKFYQNYFFHPESSLIKGKTQEEIKGFTRSKLYHRLRDLGDILGFRQGYVKPARGSPGAGKRK